MTLRSHRRGFRTNEIFEVVAGTDAKVQLILEVPPRAGWPLRRLGAHFLRIQRNFDGLRLSSSAENRPADAAQGLPGP